MPGRFLLLFLLLFSFSAHANFDFNTNCVAAYNNIMDLKLNAARTLISAEKKKNPQNSITVLLENYIDYYELITSENKADFDRLKANKDARIARLEKEDTRSPYYLYCLAEVNLQWALLRGNFHEYYTAGRETVKAYNYLQDNAKKFPAFLPNQKGLGMVNALLGSLPEGLKRGLSLIGIKGNTQAGIRMLENLVSKLPRSAYSHFYDEAVYSLAYIQTDIVKDTLAYEKMIKNTDIIQTSSLLRASMRGYVSMKTAHNAEAITILTNRPSGSMYEPYPYLDYLLGTANIHRLDKSAAGFLQTYLKNYKGINYIKDTYLNLAWLELLSGDMAGYNSYIALVKTKGYSYHDKDKQALKEAGDPAPNIDLLKARLLFDGGYYDKGLNILEDKKAENFKSVHDKIEYNYRSGRLYDASGKNDPALKFYQLAINAGKNERYYFAANAALSMGLIYEKTKNYAKAKSSYNAAIAMKNHDYENSIENKAKEGLNRIGG